MVITSVLNQCLQSWDGCLFQLCKQYSSALLLADRISSLPSTWHKEGSTENYRGDRTSSTWKKKIILYRWEQVCFNSEMFPSGAKLSLDSLKQDVPLRVSRPKKRSYPTQQSSSCFLVLDHACQVQQQGQRDETFWVSPPSKKCSNGHILKHTE